MKEWLAILVPIASVMSLVSIAACKSASVPETESTAEILSHLAKKIGPEVPFVGEWKVADKLARYRNDDSPKHFDMRLRLAQALVRVGKADEAVGLYDELWRRLDVWGSGATS